MSRILLLRVLILALAVAAFLLHGRDKPIITAGSMDGKSAARMPAYYLRPEKRRLSDLPPDATAYINFTDVAVDLTGETYVDPGS